VTENCFRCVSWDYGVPRAGPSVDRKAVGSHELHTASANSSRLPGGSRFGPSAHPRSPDRNPRRRRPDTSRRRAGGGGERPALGSGGPHQTPMCRSNFSTNLQSPDFLADDPLGLPFCVLPAQRPGKLSPLQPVNIFLEEDSARWRVSRGSRRLSLPFGRNGDRGPGRGRHNCGV
jgi:hypothetical protein